MRISALAVAAIFGFGTAHAAEHGIAMHGTPKYAAGFSHFDYVNPAAPKGGGLRLARIGTFDNLNNFVILGVRAAGLPLTYQTLLKRALDEPFSLYGYLAERIDTPPDRTSITFHLNTAARFRDGQEVTAEDVVFSWRILRDKGRPNHRHFYAQVAKAEILAPRAIRFTFKDSGNRELPLIMGLMPVLSATEFERRPFDKATLTPLMGSGPYRIESFEAGRSITYRRIDGHWAADLPTMRGHYNFDTIRYDYYRDRSSAIAAFQAGAFDLWVENDPRRWATGFDFPAARDGRVKRKAFPHQRPVGMFAIALNSRRAHLTDPKVRQAIGLALDFEWINKNLFHGAYRRSRSFFENSELAARATPKPAKSGRQRLRQARALLRQAGWRVVEGRLVDDSGRPFRLEFMLGNRDNEKWIAHLARNLERLGMTVRIRLVDSAQYQARANSYEFDAMVNHWGASLSPGNEQAFYWGSAAAERPGTRNYPGIRDPIIDGLIQTLSDAPDRRTLVDTARALDRRLRDGHYVVPLFHQITDRVMYWDKFAWPAKLPLYGYQTHTWWRKP